MLATHENPKSQKNSRNIGGKVKQNGVDPGKHTFTLMSVHAFWSKKELKVDEEIDATADTTGIPDGKLLTFSFYEKNINTPDRSLGEIKLKVSGNKAKTTWKYPQSKVHQCSGPYSPTLFFRVSYDALSGQSSQISVFSDLSVKLENEDGTAVASELVQLRFTSGHVIEAKTDGSGIFVFKKVPPCLQYIRFPHSPHAESVNTKQINFSGPSIDKVAIPQGSSKPNLFRQITLFYYCLHKFQEQRRCVANSAFFEVVPEYKGSDAYKDEVTILSKTPRALTVKGTALEKLPEEYRMHAYSLKCNQEFGGLVPEFWNVQFWQNLANPIEYQISGLPRPLTVKCYRPDAFKMQIKFPSMRKWSGGRKVNEEGAQYIYEVKHKLPKTPIDFEYKKAKEGWDLTKFPRPMSEDLPIALQRNGQQITLDFLKSVGAVIDLAKKISDISNFIQDNVPKVGWYIDWENQFFQGTFVIEWGWKEYKDHRAYFYVGFNIDIKLLDLKFEIGVGVSGFACKLQIYGVISGSVSISLKGSRASPDGDVALSLPFSTEIIGALGARFEGGYFVRLEGNAETGLKLNDGELKWTSNEGISCACTLQWTGIKAKVKVSAGPGKKKGEVEGKKQEISDNKSKKPDKEFKEQASDDVYEHELIKSVDLKKWQWPDSKFQYNPPVIPRKDLHDLILSKLVDGDDIRVKYGDGFLTNDYLPMSSVAEQIEEVIHWKKNLRKDPKTAEALAFEIRKNLETLLYKHPEESGLPHISLATFNKFLATDLPEILKRYIDPMQTIINQHH